MADQPSLEQRCAALVAEVGLGQPNDIERVVPLTGGVASDVARVEIGGRAYCMKFALSRLRVAEDWRAPVHRNAAEYAWLSVAAGILPGGAIALFGRSETLHGFAMEFLEGEDIYLWKSALLAEAPDRGEAAAVGDALGRIHAASTAPGFDRAPFRNNDDFRALRLEPYLTFTASRHPEVSGPLDDLAEALYRADKVLVHGDVSPKNIFFRGPGPAILDAECATMGDASFDPAFCLNHLILKAIHLPGSRQRLLGMVAEFWSAYRVHVTWEDADGLQERICRLLPALMLARIDGKSPVEYLSADEGELVRRIAVGLIRAPRKTLGDLSAEIARKTGVDGP